MTLCLPCSEGDAVCQPDESAGLGHRRHGRAALRAAGGTAGPGKLGGEEVGLGFVLGSRRECAGNAPGSRPLCPRPCGPKHPRSQLCKPLVSYCPCLGAVSCSMSSGLL